MPRSKEYCDKSKYYVKKGDIMECKVYKLNELKEYKYVVILSKYQGKILLSRHKKRSTWETQGGHIEKGETPLEAAKRELFEESGAVKFSILPVFDYWAGDDKSGGNGMVFMAEITELSDIPDSEMEEVQTFLSLPDSLTYPEITPVLFANAKEYIINL
jgi:8-oxo-dGTP diphosphatase